MKNGKRATQKIILNNKNGPPKKWVKPSNQIINIVKNDPEIRIIFTPEVLPQWFSLKF